VEWATLLSAGLGAGFGISSTLLTDRVRWRRDHLDRQRESNRQLYAQYLAALWRTLDDIRDAARTPNLPADERARLAREALKGNGAYELRYQVSIIAGDAVDTASLAAFRVLRDLRDHVEAGATHQEPTYRQAREDFNHHYAALREQMRAEAGLLGAARVSRTAVPRPARRGRVTVEHGGQDLPPNPRHWRGTVSEQQHGSCVELLAPCFGPQIKYGNGYRGEKFGTTIGRAHAS
jgi:hypothetical protein